MFQDVLPCKTTLIVNAITVKAANTYQSKSRWNPGPFVNTNNYFYCIVSLSNVLAIQ